MIILGIESTCDETGIAVVRDGVEVITSEISSSVEFQKKFGGVIPEIAAREQVKVIVPLLGEVLAKCPIAKVDAIAVSYGPGLIGSLVIGVETAKAIALAYKKGLIAFNHLVGHIYANWLGQGTETKEQNLKLDKFPLIALIVSGGHTDLVLMKDHCNFALLGSTLDDAIGEAFDKVSKKLGLGYPGGPEVEKWASEFTGKTSFNLPRPMVGSGDYNFSFSGLKTAVATIIDKNRLTDKLRREVSFAFQKAAIDVLVKKTLTAADKYGAQSIVVGGGVAANKFLRQELNSASGVNVFFPEKRFSVDNGAMIAAAAFFEKNFVDPLELTADSSIHFNKTF